MLTGKRLQYLADLLPENVLWGDPLDAGMLEQILTAHSAGAREPVVWRHKWTNDHAAEWAYKEAGPKTDELRIGIPGVLGPDSHRECWEPLYAQPQPMTDASRHLSDLLARIHRDGGQYEAEHGIDKAVADADDKVTRLNAMTDAARDMKRWREKIIRAMRAPSRGDFTVEINATVREMTAEIERLDRAKGE